MADKAIVLTPVVTVDAIDISELMTSVSLEKMVAILEFKTSGTTAVGREASIGDFKFSVDVYHDAAHTILDHFWDLVGTKVTCTYKPASGSVSSTNPLFTFTSVVGNLPHGGQVGEAMKFTWNLAVDGEVVKTTS